MEFTEEANQIIIQAKEEARFLNHEYIGTEHLLLAFCRGVGLHYVPTHIQPRNIRHEIGKLSVPGPSIVNGNIPKTPRANSVIRLALLAAMGQPATPQHILDALFQEQDGVAYHVMLNLNWFPKPESVEPQAAITQRLAAIEKRLSLLEEKIG